MSLKTVGTVIIGGGITGVTVGRLLQQGGFDDFVILEKELEPGGLCRSRVIGGHVLDLGGGHLLCSKYRDVYQFIFDHLPASEFNSFDRVSKIALHDHVIDYPIEYNLWQLPIDEQITYLLSCIRAGESEGDRRANNFEEWVRGKLGDAIADNYMIPYNRKIWASNRMNSQPIGWKKFLATTCNVSFAHVWSGMATRPCSPATRVSCIPNVAASRRFLMLSMSPSESAYTYRRH